jgi:hypothetical protein
MLGCDPIQLLPPGPEAPPPPPGCHHPRSFGQSSTAQLPINLLQLCGFPASAANHRARRRPGLQLRASPSHQPSYRPNSLKRQLGPAGFAAWGMGESGRRPELQLCVPQLPPAQPLRPRSTGPLSLSLYLQNLRSSPSFAAASWLRRPRAPRPGFQALQACRRPVLVTQLPRPIATGSLERAHPGPPSANSLGGCRDQDQMIAERSAGKPCARLSEFPRRRSWIPAPPCRSYEVVKAPAAAPTVEASRLKRIPDRERQRHRQPSSPPADRVTSASRSSDGSHASLAHNQTPTQRCRPHQIREKEPINPPPYAR